MIELRDGTEWPELIEWISWRDRIVDLVAGQNGWNCMTGSHDRTVDEGA